MQIYFELVKPYLWCANLGQVFYFIANTLTVILLRFTEEKYQLVINILFLIVFVGIGYTYDNCIRVMGNGNSH